VFDYTLSQFDVKWIFSYLLKLVGPENIHFFVKFLIFLELSIWIEASEGW